MIYLLTAVGLTPGGSSTVHIYTQTIHRATELNNWKECGPCPVFASYNPGICLTTEKKGRETLSQGSSSVMVGRNLSQISKARLHPL
jgi:hypothetical protein